MNSFRLDSARATPASTRWSCALDAPVAILRCDANGQATLRVSSGERRRWSNPIAALDWLGRQTNQPAGKGIWVGYLSYDLGRYFENLPATATDDLHLPLFVFTFHRLFPSPGIPGEGRGEGLPMPPQYRLSRSRPRSNFSRRSYEAAVGRAIAYIAAGDVFQVNLSQRITTGLSALPREIYARLLKRFPAWYGAFLDYGDHALLCNSPELFLRVTPEGSRRRVITCPIKGTRPRCRGMKTELRKSLKDLAELNMIVDLERNDLGRVCRMGSVKVVEPRIIESHPTVYHGAATISGILRDDVTLTDLLRATFPGGSVTGAPKIRAMQIIEELEGLRRGPYCGAIGYLCSEGHIQFNMAIRTIVAASDRAHLSVGGGIVADSDPADEYRETLVKARAMLAALNLTAEDLT